MLQHFNDHEATEIRLGSSKLRSLSTLVSGSQVTVRGNMGLAGGLVLSLRLKGTVQLNGGEVIGQG